MSDSPTFAQAVNTAVDNMTQGDDGKWSLPEGLDEATSFAANSERRRRDTQSALDNSTTRTKALETENSMLVSGWEKDVVKTLSSEQRTELDELKATNPDAWREKMDEYEETNRTTFAETRTNISKEANEGTELEQRTAALLEYNEANPDHQITDEVLDNDIPPRLLKQLENGDVNFAKFLSNVNQYMTSGKVIQDGEKPPTVEDMSDVGGSHTPSSEAVEASASESYVSETY